MGLKPYGGYKNLTLSVPYTVGVDSDSNHFDPCLAVSEWTVPTMSN